MSDIVTVSRKMQNLVIDALDKSYAFEVADNTYDRDVARTAFKQAEDALLREIATLEAEEEPLHLEGNPPTFECARCRKMVPMGAHTCRPQTPGEAMPKKLPVDPVIEWLIDYLKVRVEFGSTSEELVRATIDSYRIENARLLTALDEKEKELRDTEHRIPPILRENTRLEQILASRDQMIAQLQSVAVLQKEEVQAVLDAANNWWENDTQESRVELIEAVDKYRIGEHSRSDYVMDKSPTSGA